MSTQNLPNAKRKRADYEDQIYRYYTQSTSSQGTSVAYLSYLLLEHLGRLQLYHVWLAMIGLTEQRVHQKVSEATYLHFIRVYQRQVQRLNTPDDYLLKITEPNLILHRHWSVFMAMKYSPWIACKLGTWSEKGQSKLRLLLAKMGIPKDEYEKPFLHMDQSMKEDVIKELFTHAPTFGLEVAVWPTFLKPSLVMGGAISALDTVHGLIALSVSTTSSKTTSSFYTLYDTLVRLEDHWAMAFQMATTLKHSMFVLMASLIARQAVKKVPAMRYTLIKDGYDPRLLAHPACLRELGALLNATLMELHQPNVPLILCILMSSTKDQPNPRFLVHGCVLNNVVWSPNVLGYMFQQAAIKVKADHSYDRFDPTFIEISVADIMDFIEQVQILIARYNANQWTN
ncbi:hypothetical protein HMI56_003783 [Coelomomyces lativittatus]|nr:hypothetical protein HMI56_003783 [Coelomomyces lativittatus]